MKRLYRRLLLITSIGLLLFVPYMHTRSCGPFIESDDFRFALFQAQMAHADELSQLYYCTYPGELSAFRLGEKDYERNCREWQQQIGGNLRDIYEIQYNLSPDDFLYAYRHQQWDDLKENTFIKALLQPENKASLQYFAFAKEIEFNQLGDFDPWNTGDEKNAKAQLDTLLERGEQEQQNTHPFLEARYNFQLIKLHYYLRDTADVINLYKQEQEGIVSDWALLYYALVQPNRVERTRLLCETYERSDEKKSFIYNYLSRKDLDTLLQVHPDIAAAWLIRGLKQPGQALNSIQAVHRLAPDYRYLPLLVTREINKLEDWIQTPAGMGFAPRVRELSYIYTATGYDTSYAYFAKENLRKDQAYLQTVKNYLESIISKSDSNHVTYGLAVAHLDNMLQQYAKAKARLQNIQPGNDSINRRQWLVEQLVADVHTSDISNAAVKASFAERLAQLHFKKDDKTRGALLLIMSQAYQKRNDVLTAGLLFMQSKMEVNNYYGYEDKDDTLSYYKIAYHDQHGTPADVDTLLAFKHKKNKTSFEKLLTPSIWGPDDFYRDLKLSLLIRQQQFKAALAVTDQMDSCFWDDHYEYRYYLTNKYIGSPEHLIPGEITTGYTYQYGDKRGILRDIVALEDSINRDPENATLYYRMGNAYYNISNNGCCWMLANYGKTDHDNFFPYGLNWVNYTRSPLNKAYLPAYYQCEAAIQQYNKALHYANQHNDRELCAKVLLMLSVCDKDKHAFLRRQADDQAVIYQYTKREPYHSPYLDLLKSKYGDTEMYADSKMYCPDVK